MKFGRSNYVLLFLIPFVVYHARAHFIALSPPGIALAFIACMASVFAFLFPVPENAYEKQKVDRFSYMVIVAFLPLVLGLVSNMLLLKDWLIITGYFITAWGVCILFWLCYPIASIKDQ